MFGWVVGVACALFVGTVAGGIACVACFYALGFFVGLVFRHPPYLRPHRDAGLPLLFAALGCSVTFGLLVAWRVAARMLRDQESSDRPRQRNVCEQCGYDLTGNMSGTCPECGSKT